MQQYCEALKLRLVDLYTADNNVISICKDYSIPRSTVYSWINRYKKIKLGDLEEVTVKNYYLLE